MAIEVDIGQTGSFIFPNFLELIQRKYDALCVDDDMREAFRVFDMDGDGFITRTELTYAMENIGLNMSKDEVEALVEEMDLDGDGVIDYREFHSMMSSMTD